MESAFDVTTHGAGMTALYAPLKSGEDRPFNILLAFPRKDMYATHPHPYFHQTIGRTTNRIANAKIEDLNNKTYQLAANNGPNNLHGGKVGWSAKEWTDGGVIKRVYDSAGSSDLVQWHGASNGKRDARKFTLVSSDGDEGFPGEVEARVWYSEGRGSSGEHVVEVEWEAELTDNNPENLETVVGMTNHAYFNLNPAGKTSEKTLLNHTAKLGTSQYLPFLKENPGIPIGKIEHFPSVPKVPFASFPLEVEDSGKVLDVDDCFVMDEQVDKIPTDTRGWPLQTLAELHGNVSGIHLSVESTEPAFQFYTGKYIDVPGWQAGEDNGEKWEAQDGYKGNAGLCIEPSKYVDAAGRKEWRSMVLLKNGQKFGAKTRYIISRQ